MLDSTVLKNPIIVAILTGVVTYLYMYWDNEQKKTRKDKTAVETVSYVPAVVVGLVAWLIMYGLTTSQPDNTVSEISATEQLEVPVNNKVAQPLVGGKIDMTNNRLSVGTDGSNAYNMIGRRNIKLPATDVFIDIAKF